MESDLLDDLLSVAAEINTPKEHSSAEDPNKPGSSLGTVHTGLTDSSDDEDNRDHENRRFSEQGRDVKRLLDHHEQPKEPSQRTKLPLWNRPYLSGAKFVKQETATYVFDVRVINPLVAANVLEQRLDGRELISFARMKMFVRNVPANKDWVVAGVLVHKSPPKTSQKGKSYCLWTLSDLKINLKTVTVFLFGSAYKQLWKTAVGTVVGILNPTVFDLKEGSKDEACLSVDNHQRLMIIGQSKDFGTCKSLKKSGEKCTAFVNVSVCEFCLYHVKQEYRKCSQRSDIQSGFSGRGLTALRNKVLGKDQVFYAGKLYVAKKSKKQIENDENRLRALAGFGPLPALPRAKKQKQAAMLEMAVEQKRRDKERLKQLGINTELKLDHGNFNGSLSKDVTITDSKKLAQDVIAKLKNKSSAPDKATSSKDSPSLSDGQVDLNVDYRNASATVNAKQQKDFKEPSVTKSSAASASSIQRNAPLVTDRSNRSAIPFLSVPSLTRSSQIDLDVPIRKKQAMKAKQNALAWVQRNGSIEKTDPNSTKGTEKGKKRILEAEAENDKKKAKEETVYSDRFKRIMAMTSKHTDLLEQRDNEEQEKYFEKLEVKERLEEKMLSTYKIACKAVRCLQCKYTSFSAADVCKTERHPLKVSDAVKRFFKCRNCTNRTACLTVVPTTACKNCGSSEWERTTMMKEKKVEIVAPKLSIRGGEQKFVNSVAGDANLDLMVPDD